MLALLVSACMSQLVLREYGAKAHKPANVEVLFYAAAHDQPVVDLKSQDVTVMDEKGETLPGESWAFSNPDMRNRQQVALLLDLGGSPTAEQRAALGAATLAFVRKLGGQPKVAVYAFDGAPEPRLLQPFDPAADQAESLANVIGSYESRDNSTDLYGAYQHVLQALRKRLDQSGLSLGAVVLIARGPDLASRVSSGQLRETIDQAKAGIERCLISVGPAAKKADLDWLATRTPVSVEDTGQLDRPLEQVAEYLDARGRSLYLLSHCSAARAGEHQLSIRVRRTVKTADGKEEEQSASLTHPFDATGFGPGCDPNLAAASRWEAAVETPPPPASTSSTKPSPPPPGNPPATKPKKHEAHPDNKPDLRLEPAR
jgi:hypothetical protein